MLRRPDLNPMIALHEKGLPVFGITHPAIVAGRGDAVLAQGPQSRATGVDHAASTPVVDRGRPRNRRLQVCGLRSQQLLECQRRALHGLHGGDPAGGSMSSHAFLSKVPIVHTIRKRPRPASSSS